jgi:MFS family permease
MFGKERLPLWTYILLSAGTLMAAIVNTVGLLIVARVIQGAGGGIFPLAFGIIRDEFPREKVAGAIGFLSALLGIGAGAGIVLGGLIVEHLHWHWLFWIPLVFLVDAVVLTAYFVPESPEAPAWPRTQRAGRRSAPTRYRSRSYAGSAGARAARG